ncbi:heat stress induced protein [Bacillus licheniformis]|nr:heat stress induced protein [Bacillus licheniformis]
MKPVVRQYTNDEKLMKDVEELREIGVAREDIYVLSHDDDRTERLADNADANTIGAEETGIKNAVGNIFNKKGTSSAIKFMRSAFQNKKQNNSRNSLMKEKSSSSLRIMKK